MMQLLLIDGGKEMPDVVNFLRTQDCGISVFHTQQSVCTELVHTQGVRAFCCDGAAPASYRQLAPRAFDIAAIFSKEKKRTAAICSLCREFLPDTRIFVVQKDGSAESCGADKTVESAAQLKKLLQQECTLVSLTGQIRGACQTVQVYSVAITRVSPAADKKLWQTQLPRDALVCCVLRGEARFVPCGDTLILPGDILAVVSSAECMRAAIRALCGETQAPLHRAANGRI